MRESYSFNKERNMPNIRIKDSGIVNNEYTDYIDSKAVMPKLSSKMQVRNDPKFQSEYNFERDARISLPQESNVGANEMTAEEEFKILMQSSQYSSGSGSNSSPDIGGMTNISSAVRARHSKYTGFPSTIEKPTTMNKRYRELMNAGGSVISNDLSISQDRSLRNHHLLNSSEYAPKSSDNYPSASTALGSNSTMIRIRGKNNKLTKKKGLIDYTAEEEYIINAKRKDVIQASERLKKLELMEK
jgi:hypothetical protein